MGVFTWLMLSLIDAMNENACIHRTCFDLHSFILKTTHFFNPENKAFFSLLQFLEWAKIILDIDLFSLDKTELIIRFWAPAIPRGKQRQAGLISTNDFCFRKLNLFMLLQSTSERTLHSTHLHSSCADISVSHQSILLIICHCGLLHYFIWRKQDQGSICTTMTPPWNHKWFLRLNFWKRVM